MGPFAIGLIMWVILGRFADIGVKSYSLTRDKYVHVEQTRNRHIYIYIYTFVCIYIYMYIYIYIYMYGGFSFVELYESGRVKVS